MRSLPTLDFKSDGATLFRAAIVRELPELELALANLPPDAAGTRVQGIEALRAILSPQGRIGAVASSVIGTAAMPVRAILFNKSPAANWSLGWHQDRAICVKEKREAPGFGPWTVKRGMQHVAPPFDLLSRMVTLRVHLDDVVETNAPLLIAPGSHVLGIVPAARVKEVAEAHGPYACLADAGDIWVYATPILHASDIAVAPTRRRVLQIDYAAEALPYGLQWLGA
jgi:hypothetical protein